MMFFMRVRRPLLAAVAAATLALAGCSWNASSDVGNNGDAGTPVKGGDLVLAINTDATSLDPALCGVNGWTQCEPIFSTLLRYDIEAQEFTPNLAESFESDDGKVWTLKLRSGVKFSDGTDFNAEAVAFNWDRIKDPATQSMAARTASSMRWEVVDDLTLEVTLDKPNYQLPYSLQYGMGFIGSPTAIKAAGEDFGNKPVGAGPFLFRSWTRGTQIDYEPNPTYWEEGKPYLDSLTVKVIAQDDQRLNALRSGEINVDWSLLTKDAKAMEAEGYNVISGPLVGGTGLMFNFDDPVMKDPLIRQAMLHAFDSAQINNTIYPGDQPVDQFLYPDSPYRDDAYGTFPEKDLDEAQRLFDEYLAKTGQDSLTVTMTTYAGIPVLEQVAQVLQAQMQEIDGLTLEIRGMDGVALSGAQAAGDFQVTMGATLSMQMDALYDIFHSTGSRNFSNYSNPKVDEALDLSRSSNDPEEVTEAYEIVAGEISKDGPLRTWRYQTGHLYYPDSVHIPQSALAIQTSGAAMWVQDVWMTE
jgi:peptide/nickel transport system substrate-binding protein